jgi:Divergent InlB B-repeat domain
VRALALVVVAAACGDGRSAPADAGDEPTGDAASEVDFAFSESAYDFGRLPARVAHPPGVVAIANTGHVAVRFAVSIDAFTIRATDCVGRVFQPGDGCTVAIDVPDVLGAVAGTLTVTAGDRTKSVALAATIEGAVQLTSTGAGVVVLSPTPDDCAGVPCYPAGTVVTATAAPDAASALYQWSDPSCGTALTCTHVVDANPYTISATFGPSTLTFMLDITGTGLGTVQVYSGFQNLIATCQASCSFAVDHAAALSLAAATANDFGGFSPPCTSGGFTCTLPAGTTSLTARFDIVPGERDVFPLASPGIVYSVDFSPAGDLVLGTSQGVVRLDASFAVRWTSPLVGAARFASDGGVFVGTADAMVKLDSTGVTQWTHAGGVTPPFLGGIGHKFAATPNGGVAIAGTVPLEILDASGVVIATPSVPAPCSVAVAQDGTIYAHDWESMHAFSASGAPLAFAGEEFPPTKNCAIAAGANQIAETDSGDIQQVITYYRYTLAGALVDIGGTDVVLPYIEFPAAGVALDPADNLFWYHPAPLSFDDGAEFSGAVVSKISPVGIVVWTIDRPPVADSFDANHAGLDIYDVAAAPDGRVAIAGVYDGPFPESGRAIVEIFPP